MTAATNRPFGEELRAIRERCDVTLTQLAEQVHYSRGHISKVERGHRVPTLAFAQECDRALESGEQLANLATAARERDSHFLISTPAQLPAAPAAFVGRSDRLSQLDDALAQPLEAGSARVVVIAGGPGIGKTALATYWAHRIGHRFADGQMFVDLHGYDERRQLSADDVLERFLRDLGVPPNAVPAGEEARAALFRSLLADKSVLLLLDNAATSEQVLPLLPTSPGCVVVVTSRVRLSGLRMHTGARHVTVPPLSVEEGVELLARMGSRPHVTREPAAARDIVARCAQLPLAVRIAAEYLASQHHPNLRRLADQLSAESNRLDLLPTTDAPSLRVVFSWSYRSLPPPAARLFRLLGLSAMPSLSIHAVGALAGLSLAETRHAIDRLCAAHLVDTSEAGRVSLHDLLLDYGAEMSLQHDHADERRQALDRLYHWYLHSAASANNALAPARGQPPLPDPPAGTRPEQFDDTDFDSALRWCETEAAGLVLLTEQAHHSGAHELAWLLAIVQFHYLYLAKPWNHWRRVCELGLASAQAAQDQTYEAWCLHNLGVAYLEMRQFDEALRCFEPAVDIRRAHTDRMGLGWTSFSIGMVLEQTGQYAHAAHRLRESSHAFQAVDFGYGIACAQMVLGSVYTHTGHLDHARRELVAARETFTAINSDDGVAYTLRSLARLERAAGDHDSALAAAATALRVCQARDDFRGVGDALHVQGLILDDIGRHDAAREALTEALAIFDRALDVRAADVRNKIADLAELLDPLVTDGADLPSMPPTRQQR